MDAFDQAMQSAKDAAKTAMASSSATLQNNSSSSPPPNGSTFPPVPPIQRLNAVKTSSSKRAYTTAKKESKNSVLKKNIRNKKETKVMEPNTTTQGTQFSTWMWGSKQEDQQRKLVPSAVETTSIVPAAAEAKQQRQQREVISTLGGRTTVDKAAETTTTKSKYGPFQTIATWQSWLVGALTGVLAVTPVLALRAFYFQEPTYEALAQLEWDTGVALVQGAVFAAVYRYALRDDGLDEIKLQNGVFNAFFLVRTLVGVRVPMSCSIPYLFCELLLSMMLLLLFAVVYLDRLLLLG